MTTLDYITVQGFKSIKSIEKLELRPINVIVGSNGAGKSNFIGVFSFLNAIRDGRLQDYVAKAGGTDRILFFGSKVTDKIHIQISFDEETRQYQIDLEATDINTLIPVDEINYFWDEARRRGKKIDFLHWVGYEAGISKIKDSSASYVRQHLAGWRIYHFHDTSINSPMKKTGKINDNRFLRPDGANLAAFLYLLRSKHEREYSLIRRAVQQVAPFFDDFELEPLALNEETIRLEWKHKQSEDYFDVSSLSDGSLRFIALATLLLQPVALRPSVILINEPELGLHPYAIALFASLVKQASVQTQVILSTQSALLLDNFEPEDVLVADLVDGGTQFRRLSTKALEVWLDEYSLGQLWEKNEIGGRPGG